MALRDKGWKLVKSSQNAVFADLTFVSYNAKSWKLGLFSEKRKTVGLSTD